MAHHRSAAGDISRRSTAAFPPGRAISWARGPCIHYAHPGMIQPHNVVHVNKCGAEDVGRFSRVR
jgi:hypothetical protein